MRVWAIWYVQDDDDDTIHIRFVRGDIFVEAIDNFFEYIDKSANIPCRMDVFKIEVVDLEKADFSLCFDRNTKEMKK